MKELVDPNAMGASAVNAGLILSDNKRINAKVVFYHYRAVCRFRNKNSAEFDEGFHQSKATIRGLAATAE